MSQHTKPAAAAAVKPPEEKIEEKAVKKGKSNVFVNKTRGPLHFGGVMLVPGVERELNAEMAENFAKWLAKPGNEEKAERL